MCSYKSFDWAKIVCLFLPKKYFEFLFVVKLSFQYLLLNCIAADTLLDNWKNFLSSEITLRVEQPG